MGLNPAGVSACRVNAGFILLLLIGGLDIVLVDNAKLGADVMDVLVANIMELHVNVESFRCRSIVGSDFVANR